MFADTQTSGTARWPLVRIASHGETTVVLCASRYLPLTVHWVGRSVVCGGDGCELCSVLPSRGLYYLPVVCQTRASILELGALSSSLLEQHCKLLHGGMQPGHVVRLCRRSAKSPVMGEVVDHKEGVQAVEQMTFARCVVALYHLPGPNPDESFDSYQERLRHLALMRSDRERARLDKVASGGPVTQS